MEALDLMRKHVGLSNAARTDDEARWELQRASRWALVFLAESVASDQGERMRERMQRAYGESAVEQGPDLNEESV